MIVETHRKYQKLDKHVPKIGGKMSKRRKKGTFRRSKIELNGPTGTKKELNCLKSLFHFILTLIGSNFESFGPRLLFLSRQIV